MQQHRRTTVWQQSIPEVASWLANLCKTHMHMYKNDRWMAGRVLLVVECHTPFISNSTIDCRSSTSAFASLGCQRARYRRPGSCYEITEETRREVKRNPSVKRSPIGSLMSLDPIMPVDVVQVIPCIRRQHSSRLGLCTSLRTDTLLPVSG